ncbi:hypothetical protein KIPE111705_04920 [Kibdelosporangium persicum]|uniref:hypothetical protein n=1 Tax=Kibdelosporangium persicum TaxID=2698649 RepID=UPI001564E25D|nr:hypothetical protein [Kibdelosporangium persicum]
MLSVVPDPASGDNDRPVAGEASLIDQIVCEGARRMLAEALPDVLARCLAEGR